jgi:hypothetical protein
MLCIEIQSPATASPPPRPSTSSCHQAMRMSCSSCASSLWPQLTTMCWTTASLDSRRQTRSGDRAEWGGGQILQCARALQLRLNFVATCGCAQPLAGCNVLACATCNCLPPQWGPRGGGRRGNSQRGRSLRGCGDGTEGDEWMGGGKGR